MMDALPEISLGYLDSGAPAVYVGVEPAETTKTLLELAPGVCAPDQALLCAKVVNHLAHEQTYTVIEDPARFAEWYRKRLAEEDPETVAEPGNFRLSSFGLPALDAISAPAITDDGLVFYAVNRQIGAPYRVTAPLNALDAPDYDPLPMADE